MMNRTRKCLVGVLVACLAVMWSMMVYYRGVASDEAQLQTGAVERGYAEWVLPEYPGWRWIEPEGR